MFYFFVWKREKQFSLKKLVTLLVWTNQSIFKKVFFIKRMMNFGDQYNLQSNVLSLPAYYSSQIQFFQSFIHRALLFSPLSKPTLQYGVSSLEPKLFRKYLVRIRVGGVIGIWIRYPKLYKHVLLLFYAEKIWVLLLNLDLLVHLAVSKLFIH